MRSTIKLNNHGKRVVSIVIILIVLFSLCFKTPKKMPENTIINKENYNLKIDYPSVKNKDMQNKMKKYIDSKKDEFINTVKDLNEDFTYEFSAINSFTSINNIVGIHITIYSYTGGNHYIREDKSYYYKESNGKEVDLNYFLKDSNSLEVLSNLSYSHVIKYLSEKNIVYNKDIVKEGTLPDINNFKHLNFKDEGLEIIFPPYQVASWADGEIKINISYDQLTDVLKKEYMKKKKNEVIINSKNRDLQEFKDKKLIAFTFDDGPSFGPTNKLLDNLNKYNARVTFFVLGSRVNQYKETILKAYKEGNQIGSHTYSHLNLFKLKEIDIIKEITNTNELIKEVIGIYPTALRPPYGNINNDIKKISNMHTILWSVDTLDWQLKNKNKIKKEIIDNAFDGAIILLHDIYDESVDGALMAMEELQKEGYAFVTIDEMAILRNITLNKTDSYYKINKK